MGYARQHRKEKRKKMKKYPKFEQGKQWHKQASGAGFHDNDKFSHTDRRQNNRLTEDELEELDTEIKDD